jgi:hypothetical protein
MSTTFFTLSGSIERYRSGIADGQGYCRCTICRHVCGVCHFASWARTPGLRFTSWIRTHCVDCAAIRGKLRASLHG